MKDKRDNNSQRKDKRDNKDSDEGKDNRPTRVINMTIGESTAGGTTSRGNKRYTRMVMATEQVPAITFDQTDLECVNYAHDDDLVVTLNTRGNKVK